MTQSFHARYFYAPGHRGDDAVELLIDKIPEAPEGKANGDGNNGNVRKQSNVDRMPPAIEHECKTNTQKSSMRGHAAIPHGNNFQWMRKKIERFIEKHVSEPPSNNHTEYGNGNNGCPLVTRKMQPTLMLQARQQQERQKKCEQIHDAVPVDIESQNFEKDCARWEEGDHKHVTVRRYGEDVSSKHGSFRNFSAF